MMLGVLQSNRDEILQALSRLQSQLSEMERALFENDTAKLNGFLDQARQHYQTLVLQ